jgi:hypothetical protein
MFKWFKQDIRDKSAYDIMIGLIKDSPLISILLALILFIILLVATIRTIQTMNAANDKIADSFNEAVEAIDNTKNDSQQALEK